MIAPMNGLTTLAACGWLFIPLDGSDRHVLAKLEDMEAIASANGGECGLEGIAALAKVRPALEVQRHDMAGAEGDGCLRGLLITEADACLVRAYSRSPAPL